MRWEISRALPSCLSRSDLFALVSKKEMLAQLNIDYEQSFIFSRIMERATIDWELNFRSHYSDRSRGSMILVLHVTTFVHSFVGDPLRQDTSAKIFFLYSLIQIKSLSARSPCRKTQGAFHSRKKKKIQETIQEYHTSR